jgi:hypothetical protein
MSFPRSNSDHGRAAASFEGRDVTRVGITHVGKFRQGLEMRISSLKAAPAVDLASGAATIQGDNGSLSECVVT